jgi:hypothetical protein
MSEDWSLRKQPGESILTPRSDSPRYLSGTLHLLGPSSPLFDPLSLENLLTEPGGKQVGTANLN